MGSVRPQDIFRLVGGQDLELLVVAPIQEQTDRLCRRSRMTGKSRGKERKIRGHSIREAASRRCNTRRTRAREGGVRGYSTRRPGVRGCGVCSSPLARTRVGCIDGGPIGKPQGDGVLVFMDGQALHRIDMARIRKDLPKVGVGDLPTGLQVDDIELAVRGPVSKELIPLVIDLAVWRGLYIQ